MDKHRSRQLCKPAKYRPMFHFPFGDKYARRERRQDKNIEITQMIADEQAARRNVAGELCFNPKDPEQPARCVLQPHGTRRTKRISLACCAVNRIVERRQEQFATQPEQPASDTQRMFKPGVHAPRNFCRATKGIVSKSSNVRKSIVLN